MSKLKHNLDIIILLITGFVLRYSIAITHSYSNDELSAIKRLSFDNLGDLIEHGVKIGDMHPAGVQLFMKLWSLIGGVNEAWMRLPFVIFGVISIFLVFKIGKEFLNRQVGMIAAVFLTFLYFPVLNSEFARPYSPGLMLTLFTAYFYLKILFRDSPKIEHGIFLGLSAAGAMYTHYFAFLFVGWLGLIGLLFIKRRHTKHLLIALFTAIVLYIPHIPVTIYHLNVGGLQWLGPPGKWWLLDFLYFAFNESVILIIGIFFLIILSFIFKLKTEYDSSKFRVLALSFAWFFGIYLLGHVLSLVSTPILKFPVMLFAFPFFLLLLANVLSKFKYQSVLLFVLTVGIGVSTIKEKRLYEPVHYELFKEVADKLHDWNKQYGNENIYSIYNLNDPYYMNFYSNQLNDEVDFDISVLEFGDAKKVRDSLLNAREMYCVVGYSARLTLVQVFETCREFYPFIVDYEKHNNSAVFLLSKYYKNQNFQLNPLLIDDFKVDNSNKNWDYNPGNIKVRRDTFLDVKKQSYQLKNDQIYGPTRLVKVGDIEDYENRYIKVNVFGNLSAKAQLTITVSAERNGEAVYNREEVFWLGHDVETMIYQKGFGYFAFKIPSFLDENDQLKISLWSRNPSEAVDIYKIQILSYPNIWN